MVDTASRAIYVDVDDTLIRSVGRKRIPMPASVEWVRLRHAEGIRLYAWSRGGGDYAAEVVGELGLAACFVACLPKPDAVLDDQLEECFSHCEFLHPTQIQRDGG